jgi:hypothetical protein
VSGRACVPVAAWLAALAGCVGPAASTRTTPPAAAPPAADAPVRRLSRDEYRNAIADLFGLPPPARGDLPDDGVIDGLVTTAGQRLRPGQWQKYLEVAADLGATIARQLPRHFPCATDALDERSCVRRFLETVGTRVFRRRLTPAEGAQMTAVFDRARAGGLSFAHAASAMVQAMLTAPQFLFLWERADAPDSWQLAARLSFQLWRTTPDAVLLEAAARDELRSPAALAAQAARLMEDPRARPVVAAFFDGWLGLDRIEELQKDPARHPLVDKGLLLALARETRRYLADLFWSQDGKLATLFESTLKVRNRTLSKYYGDDLGKDEEIHTMRVEPSEQSFGLLSQAGLLMAMGPADDSAIIHRGKFLRTRVLCGVLPPPPPGVPPLPVHAPGMTGRQRVEAHTDRPSCYGCHSEINPLGFALEHFDGGGRWRDSEAGQPVDARAEIEDGDIAGTVGGARELSQRLGASDDVRRCAARRLYEFALGRPAGAEDVDALHALETHLRASDGSLKALLLEAVSRVQPVAPRAARNGGPPAHM